MVIIRIFFPIFLVSLASSSSDTLKQGDELNFSSSTFLVSAQKVFTLGFFIPPRGVFR
ncbi:hypothetical protein CsSME_00044365 [Camellia sinensis var. sinensis]